MMSLVSSNLRAALEAKGTGSEMRVKVVPNASRSRVSGMLGDRLKVQLAAPAEDGRANRALCELISKSLGVKKADVIVTAGHAQPHKTVAISALSPDEIIRRLHG